MSFMSIWGVCRFALRHLSYMTYVFDGALISSLGRYPEFSPELELKNEPTIVRAPLGETELFEMLASVD